MDLTKAPEITGFEITGYEIDAVDISVGSDTVLIYLPITVSEKFFTNLIKEYEELHEDEWCIVAYYEKSDNGIYFEIANDGMTIPVELSAEDIDYADTYLEEHNIIEIIKKSKPENGISFAQALKLM